MNEQEFNGHVTLMRADAEFVGAEDIMGRGDVPMQIAKVVQYTNRKACGKTQPTMFTLHFHRYDKELWIKATNRKQLTKLFGPDASKWKDRWIWLHVEECKSPQGGMTLGVRIRDRTDAPKQQASSEITADELKEVLGKLRENLQTTEAIEAKAADLGVCGKVNSVSSWTRELIDKAREFIKSQQGPQQ